MDLQYPVGKFTWQGSSTEKDREQWIGEIEQAPALLRKAVAGLSDQQADTPYRPGGWTVRQVVHHMADSHMNAFLRFRLALTEDEPTIKPYDQVRWSALTDSRTAPMELSLALFESMHQRWTILLQSFSAADCARTFRHPEIGVMTLDRTLGMYAWHSRHHVAHITGLREREGWK
jgi:hypothetical protein